MWLAVLSHCRLQSVRVNSWKEVPTLLNSLRETHPCLAFRFYSDWDCNPMIQCFQDAKFIVGRTNMLVQLAAFLQESIASHAWPNVALPQHCSVYLNTQKQFVSLCVFLLCRISKSLHLQKGNIFSDLLDMHCTYHLMILLSISATIVATSMNVAVVEN